MQFSVSQALKITLVNPVYAPRSLDSKTLNVVVTATVRRNDNLGDLNAAVVDAVAELNGSTVVDVNDPFCIKLLEPKAGNTVHTFLEKKKANLNTGAQRTYARLGGTIPPDTVNGYVVYLVNDALCVQGADARPGMETVGHLIFMEMISVNAWVSSTDLAITLSDGDLSVTLDNDDLRLS